MEYSHIRQPALLTQSPTPEDARAISLFLHRAHRLQQLARIEADRLCDLHELDDLDSALTILQHGDGRLVPAEFFCKLRLRHLCLLAPFGQENSQDGSPKARVVTSHAQSPRKSIDPMTPLISFCDYNKVQYMAQYMRS